MSCCRTADAWISSAGGCCAVRFSLPQEIPDFLPLPAAQYTRFPHFHKSRRQKTIEFFLWRGEKLRSGRNRRICATRHEDRVFASICGGAMGFAKGSAEGVYSRYTTEGSGEQGGLCKNRSPAKAGAHGTKTGFLQASAAARWVLRRSFPRECIRDTRPKGATSKVAQCYGAHALSCLLLGGIPRSKCRFALR